jgi:hypothetical protein
MKARDCHSFACPGKAGKDDFLALNILTFLNKISQAEQDITAAHIA